MYNASQNCDSLAKSGTRQGGALVQCVKHMSLIAALISLLFVTPIGAEDQFRTIRSYNGNFLVTAPDPALAGWVARAAELTREKVFGLLECHSEWQRAASIILRYRTEKEAEGELRLWTISVTKGAFKTVASDVYPNKRDDAVVLRVVELCVSDMAGLTAPQEKLPPAAPVPPWLFCGIAENLSAANLSVFREYIAEAVRKEDFLPLEQLFRTDFITLDETQRELFFKQSASVVDFLLHRQDGRSRLREAIARLSGEKDFTASLLFAFSRDFGALPQLQESWKKFAVLQAERTIGSSRMPLSETKKALDRVLIADIPTVDRDSLEEKLVTTDLPGLFRHRNRLIVQQIASQKASEVFSLSLRAKPEYGPILQEYLLAITAIAKDDRAEFRKHFALAERLRKRLEESPEFKAKKDENANPSDQ